MGEPRTIERPRRCGRDSSTRESRPDLPRRGGGTIQCRRPRPGKPRPGRRRTRNRCGAGRSWRRRKAAPEKATPTTSETAKAAIVQRSANEQESESVGAGAPGASPGGRTVELRDQGLNKWLSMYTWCTVSCPLAPSRGGVLRLRGNPVRGSNPRSTWSTWRPVFTFMAPSLRTRTPHRARAL